MSDQILKDLRYSFRSLLRVPAFTILAISILALGIGANTAIFSALYGVLIKSLPFPEPERLVVVWGTNGRAGTNKDPVSATDIADYRAQNTSFEDITTFETWRPSLSGGNETERVSAMMVGDGYFKIMKANPYLGRTFLPENQTTGKDFVVILSYGLWKRQFAGDRGIVGRVIRLNARQYTVVGVMPPDFHSLPIGLVPKTVELYRPVAEGYDNEERGSRHLNAIGRLKPNATLDRAQSEMSSIAKRLEKLYPVNNLSRGINLVTFPREFAGKLKSALYLLAGAAALVLLIACANIANLLLARTTEREREMAIRVSLGAPVSALIRQLFFECLLISVAGCFLGLLLALWGVEALSTAGGKVLPQLLHIQINFPVLFFSAGVTIVSCFLLSMAPAHHIRSLNLHDALKEGGRGTGTGIEKNRLRGLLVISEMALAIILLVGAGLFMRSVLHLYNVDPGFQTNGVLTMNLALQGAKFPEEPQRIAFYNRVMQRVNALPGIQSAGLTTVLPLSDNFDGRTIAIEGQYRDPSEEPEADMYVVTPGYLTAMNIPLLQGRLFTDQDSEKAPMTAIVSESFAKHFWPNQNPLGRRIRLFPGPKESTPWRTVVGVVNDVKQYGLNTTPPHQFYVPNTQFGAYSMTLVAKTSGDPSSYASTIRKAILEVDSEQAAFDISTLNEVLGTSIGLQRFSMILLGCFALLALCLASAGIYAVISYVTSRRTHEIGIRMALGAQQGDVLRMILRQGLVLAGIGAVAGLLASAALTRLTSSLLFNVNPTDPLTYATIAVLLLFIALLACGIPAIRATKVDPMIALRYE
jgi:putative ABC transport system permease protein